MFQNIPEVFKQYRQWVVWTNRDENGYPTKRPLKASDGWPASPTNPAHWCDFDTAVATAEQYPERCAGIGFVLTADDPFVCIDLDDPTKHGFDQENVNRIYRLGNNVVQDMNSYAEWSPSGNGLHVWVTVPDDFPIEGVKSSQDCIEIYSSARFMTFTGRSFDQEPKDVAYRPEVRIIYDSLAKLSKPLLDIVEEPWSEPVDQTIAKLRSWQNGEKFWQLFNTTDEQAGSSKSEVDQGLMNFLVRATKNVQASKTIFLMSERGKRDKAKREDYLDRTIRRAFDEMNGAPLINIEELIASGKESLRQQREAEMIRQRQQTEPTVEKPVVHEAYMTQVNGRGVYTNPGGLLGHITDYLYHSSYRPIPEVALAGAIGLMAGIAGRAYNVAGVGLNQYVVLLAPTGVGKNAAIVGPGKLVRAIEGAYEPIKSFIGPRFASAQALQKYFANHPSFVSFYDEWGEIFEKMSNPDRYPNQGAFVGPMMELYTASVAGGSAPGVVHSKADESTRLVMSPAYSFVGVSVPSTFYEAIQPKMGTKGLLPRLTIVEYTGGIVAPNDEAHLYQPPQWLLNDLKTFATQSVMVNNGMKVSGVKPIEIGWGGEARAMWEQFRDHCDRNTSAHMGNEIIGTLWSRTAEKAKRLAGLVAVGYSPLNPVVTVAHMNWATNFANHEAELITRKFEAGEVGQQDNESERFADIMKYLRRWFFEMTNEQLERLDARYPLLRGRNLVPRSWLFTRINKLSSFKNFRGGASDGLEKVIFSMGKNGLLKQVPEFDLSNGASTPNKFNGMLYQLTDVSSLSS